MGNTENLQYPATFCMTKRNVKANVNIPTTSHIDLKNDKIKLKIGIIVGRKICTFLSNIRTYFLRCFETWNPSYSNLKLKVKIRGAISGFEKLYFFDWPVFVATAASVGLWPRKDLSPSGGHTVLTHTSNRSARGTSITNCTTEFNFALLFCILQ